MNKQTKKEKIAAPVVITCHANADFDALAGMIAAGRLYPKSVLIFPGSQEKNLRNFYIESTTYLFNFKNFKEIDPDTVETLVVVDTRQRSRIPHVRPLLDKPGLKIHTFDHHPDSNDDLKADEEYWKPWGSTATIISLMLRDRNINISPEEATIIALGLYEDTGNLGFSTVSPEDFEAGAWLKRQGMDLEVISDLLKRELSSDQIAVLGQLLQNATTHDVHGIEVCVTEVSTETFFADFAFLIHKMMDVEDIGVLFALGRMGDRIHLVARSKNPEVNVGRICSELGGGGHAFAASATIKDKTMSELRDELFQLFYSQINPQQVVRGLMSMPAKVIEDTLSLAKALEFMGQFSLKSVPVVAQGTMRCVGVIQQKIVDKAVSHGLGDYAVSEYMMTDFLSVPRDTELYAVMDAVLGNRQRLVPVIENDEVVGVISRTDLVNLLVEEPARIPESLNQERSREKSVVPLIRSRLPKDVVSLLKLAGALGDEHGFEVYVVGGFVRDLLMDKKNFDIDLVVEGDGIAFGNLLADKLGGRVKAHRKFQTCLVILENGQRIDVATARLEYYEYPAALPTVELSSIKMDLYRRDFTVNALAIRLNTERFGQLVDFFGAEQDIRHKRIRVLHSLSFVEDPTRILRAIRFERRFGFRIGGQTMRLIKNALQLNMFNRLSGSRITHELQLIVQESSPLDCFNRMKELGLLKAIHPFLELTNEKIGVIMELSKVLDWYRMLYLEREAEPWRVYMLGLSTGLNREQTEQVCERLHFTPRDRNELLVLRDQIGDALMRLMNWKEGKSLLSELVAFLDPIPVEGIIYLMARSRKEHIRRNISQYLARLRDVAIGVNGEDLKAMGVPIGPVFTCLLESVKADVIDGVAVSRAEQLEAAEKKWKQWKADGITDGWEKPACPRRARRVKKSIGSE